VGVAELVDALVAGPAVGDDPGAGLDVCGDERVERGGRAIGQDLHPGTPEPARLGDLNCHAYQDFLALGSSTAQSWLSPGSSPPM